MSQVTRPAAIIWMICAGCHAHVAIQAPPPHAAPEAREKAYAELRPLSYHETHSTTYRGGVATGARRTTDYLQLANGTRIYYPEDLLAVLPPDSPSAIAANQSAASRQLAYTFDIIAMLALTAGTAVMTLPILVGDVSFAETKTPLYAGMGIMNAGLVVWLISQFGLHPSVEDSSATAYETFDAGLRDRLEICHEDGRDFSCGDSRKEQLPSQPTIVTQGGCAKDVDCKGNRVCDQGVCVDPTPVIQPVESPPAKPQLQEECNLCPTRCVSHKTQCNAGSVAACYQLGACICQCQLDFGGCGRMPADLEACVTKNAAKAAP